MNVDHTNGHAWLLCHESMPQNDESDIESVAQKNDLDDTVIDPATSAKINAIIDDIVIPCRDVDTGQLLKIVSQAFLDTPYHANRLIGSLAEQERLVADVSGVDCFTLLDYVCALAKSHSHSAFIHHLQAIRYQGGEVNFLKRNHFFSDWFARKPANAVDITDKLSADAITVTKHLNRKGIDEEFIPGLGIVEREIHYIPTEKIDDDVIAKLNSGDLMGIYSKSHGLDVSHVGFCIKDPDGVYFRNASSLEQNMKVVDSPFERYLTNKLGIVVLRVL
ncbi:N-acetylmuramoyl-L-alanine amidase-like domain-containing protein [Acerihabitans sp. TG2]|uniref:N-acetylmuramoyl-L-alanine amidase-like domain-containing protein n=1 Tax=Acerihabitans sp. TG2 TaxID=3096008 RepID=UPI002B229D47|nr:N-acetylmuramoyl-L-alanine amidase-like domain-containing protein [Acerihabitans sp. TG2]MEA9390406.1 N-acetylmuramoyl-L-alanine amidase-like domain-containing protein [Acerihabitans sp. TG2]